MICPTDVLKSPARENPTYRKVTLKTALIAAGIAAIVAGPIKLTRKAETEETKLTSPLKMK